jgi:hypothetical protein
MRQQFNSTVAVGFEMQTPSVEIQVCQLSLACGRYYVVRATTTDLGQELFCQGYQQISTIGPGQGVRFWR